MGRIRLFGLYFALLGALGACASDTLSGDHVENRAPTVWLAAGPPEGSIGTYTVQLYWGGWDPDGEISYYEYFVSDNVTGVFNPADTVGAPWAPVVGNDSLFTFSADSLTETGTVPQRAVFTRSHTFFIRSVDEVGLRSREPAHRSFTSRTISPEARITTPRQALGITPASMPPIPTFTWRATDFIDDDESRQDPDSVQWALVSTSRFNNSYTQAIAHLSTPASAPDWYPWSWYQAPLDSGKSWTPPPLEFGQYVFAIRAKDEAGAITPVLEEPVNVRRINVQSRLTGPSFVVTSPLIGSVVAASCNYPLTIVDIPAGVGIGFTLSACAQSYGGTVAGYRYGWDILDLTDPSQWEIDYTPFVTDVANVPVRSFSFGTHTFTSEVIDNSGYCSRIEIKFNIVRFTGERNLLIVDDFFTDRTPGAGWITSNGGLPSDAEHDAFWLDMVSDLEDFDPSRDVIEVTQAEELPLTTAALYKNMIWSVAGNVDASAPAALPLFYRYVQYHSRRPPRVPQEGACSSSGGIASGKATPNLVGLAMQAGVHVLITGTHPVQNARSRTESPGVRWPAIPAHEFEVGNSQVGTGPADLEDPPGTHAFAYNDLCIDALEFALQTNSRLRVRGSGLPSTQRYCGVNGWRTPNANSTRDDTMRGALTADPNFPPVTLRFEVAGPTRAYAPTIKGIDAEVYNPAYFRQGAACSFVLPPRPCFEPIYLLDCLDTSERTYQDPIAFWTTRYADVVSPEIPGAIAARSAVFGFPPVYFNPAQIKPGIEYILFDEWQLPRRTGAAQARLDETAGSP